jgi:hypothetical protein
MNTINKITCKRKYSNLKKRFKITRQNLNRILRRTDLAYIFPNLWFYNGLANALFAAKRKHISLLLGAGFSFNKGYPLGKDINEALLDFKNKYPSVYFASSGKLCDDEYSGNADNFGWNRAFDLCIYLMEYYNIKEHGFNYEKFYDYLFYEAKTDTEARKYVTEQFAKTFDMDFRDNDSIDESAKSEYKNAITNKVCKYNNEYDDHIQTIIRTIYNQLVMFLLKDENGHCHYDETNSISDKYNGFLTYLSNLSQNYIVDIHTLNHDLLFESFNNTVFFQQEKICDGFSAIKSEYYNKNNAGEKCVLEKYCHRYETRFRLYKLHGSINYRRFYEKIKHRVATHKPSIYIKHPQNGYDESIYKEGIDEMIDIDFIGDILTGTTTKILRYNEHLLYKNLFKLFAKNLKKSEVLIVCGYGGGDDKINEKIKRFFDYHHKPIFVIDPKVPEFFSKLKNVHHIITPLESISARNFKLNK